MAKKLNMDPIFQTRFLELYGENYKPQKEIAKELGTTRPTFSSWLNGNVPDGLSLKRIALYFNVSTDYLLGLSDTRKPDVSLRAAVEYTGLSEAAVECLHHGFDHTTDEITDEHEDLKKKNLLITSDLIRNQHFAHLIHLLQSLARETYSNRLLMLLKSRYFADHVEKPLSSTDREGLANDLIHVLEIRRGRFSDAAHDKTKYKDDRVLYMLLQNELRASGEHKDLCHFKASRTLDRYLDHLIRKGNEQAAQKFSK